MNNLSGQSFPFSILKKDYENSEKDYCEPSNCPATVAIKRQFDIDATAIFSLIVPQPQPINKELGKIEHSWGVYEFEQLVKGIEFHTTITFL